MHVRISTYMYLLTWCIILYPLNQVLLMFVNTYSFWWLWVQFVFFLCTFWSNRMRKVMWTSSKALSSWIWLQWPSCSWIPRSMLSPFGSAPSFFWLHIAMVFSILYATTFSKWGLRIFLVSTWCNQVHSHSCYISSYPSYVHAQNGVVVCVRRYVYNYVGL